MRNLTNTPLDISLNNILKNPNETEVTYEAILHTLDTEFKPIMISNLEIMENYNSKLYEDVRLIFYVGLGEYIKHIHDNRDNLEIVITRKQKMDTTSIRYKAVITSTEDIDPTAHKVNKDDLNVEMIGLNIQAIDRVVETMVTYNIDGVYKQISIDALFHHLYGNTSDLKIEGEDVELSVNITPPDNTTSYKHIILPTGLKLLDVPMYLQDTKYGVYNGDIGVFIKNINNTSNIFIYPLYSSTKFNESKNLLQVYFFGDTKLDHIDNTYLVENNIVNIIGTNINISNDDSETNLFSKGSYVNTDINSILENNTITTDDSTYYDKNLTMTGKQYKERRDGVINQNYGSVTNNPYSTNSKITSAEMMFISIDWKYSDRQLLKPGMGTKFIYYDEDMGIIELLGTLQVVYTMYNGVDDKEVSKLVIAVNKRKLHE